MRSIAIDYQPTEYKLEDTVFFCQSTESVERESVENYMTLAGVQEYEVKYRACAVCGQQVDEYGHVYETI